MSLFGNKKDDNKKSDTKDTAKKVVVKDTKEEKPSMKELYSEGKKKVVKKSKGKKVETKKADYQGAYRILVKPLITEKATHLASENKYVFIVANEANKIEVALAVETVYGVKPIAVNMVKVKGKAVARGRIKGKRKDFKKAIVTLEKGDSIKLYEGV